MSEYPEIPQESWPVAAPSPEATNGASPQSPHLTDELLAGWAANELADDERGAVQRHLDTCAYCQSALAETQRIRALARASATSAGAPVASASLVEHVLARLPDQSQPARDITAHATDSTP
ncbi:MAG TPA: zf-HC2 domain-containing protein, partial [Ktedonobacterales bacterium]